MSIWPISVQIIFHSHVQGPGNFPSTSKAQTVGYSRHKEKGTEPKWGEEEGAKDGRWGRSSTRIEKYLRRAPCNYSALLLLIGLSPDRTCMRLVYIINNGDGRILRSPLRHGRAHGRRHPGAEERMMKITGTLSV